MSCGHNNPVGYRFCSQCGAVLAVTFCRCGFAAQANDTFCGGCGTHLHVENASDARLDPTFRYDLKEIIAASKSNENVLLETGAHVTQDDIERLVANKLKEQS